VRQQATADRRTRVTMEIQEERIRPLNEKDVREGDYVLYWMQEAQRAEYNHALEYAVQRANDLEQRLLVVFGLMDVSPPIDNDPDSSPRPRTLRGCRPCGRPRIAPRPRTARPEPFSPLVLLLAPKILRLGVRALPDCLGPSEGWSARPNPKSTS
jgi:hypothetical protein